MKKLYKAILLAFLAVFICCKKNIENSDKQYAEKFSLYNNSSNSIDYILLKDLENEKRNLSQLVKKLEYIPLETDTASIVGSLFFPPRDFEFFEEDIFVKNALGRMCRFDDKGKFLNFIGDIGRGPGEYVNPWACTVFKTENTVQVALLADVLRKILIYDINGNFLYDIPINYGPLAMDHSYGHFFLVTPMGNRSDTKYNVFSTMSLHGDLKESFFYKGNEKGRDMTPNSVFDTYVQNDTLSFWERGYDTIWRVTDNLKLSPKYIVGYDTSIETSNMKNKKNVSTMTSSISNSNRIANIVETSSIIFLDAIKKNRFNTFIYEKKTRGISKIQYDRLSEKGFHFALNNDIDGGLPFWPVGKISDNKVFMTTYGYKVKEFLEKNTTGDYDPEAREKLWELVKDAKMTDNIILVVATLKDD